MLDSQTQQFSQQASRENWSLSPLSSCVRLELLSCSLLLSRAVFKLNH